MMNTYTENKRAPAGILLWALAALLLLLAGCGKDSGDGTVENSRQLPTDDTLPLSLYCADIGIYTNQCILDDPANPYARAAIGNEDKFDLDATAPSATARFYLWGTALARGVGAPGENQFYVALNLHRMWASSNSELTRQQALRAYQSYLDNYFDSVTYFEIPLDSEEFFPFSLNQFTGEMLFDPTDVSNTFVSTRLFSPDPVVNRDKASQIVADWGYYYDQDNEIFSRIF